jgi:predicted O-methyltransferase YrrM
VRIGHWIRHPARLVARIRYLWWEKRNPDKPWLTPGAVAFLDAQLKSDMSAVEFGSGRSTAWYAAKVGRLLSIEHNAEWFALVTRDLAARGISNVDYRLVSLDHDESMPEQPKYDPLPRYVAVIAELPDDSLDLVIVDGHYRTTCIVEAQTKLKPGGLLLVDDANLWPADRPPIPETWPEVSRTTNGIKFTAIWRKPPAADASRGRP